MHTFIFPTDDDPGAAGVGTGPEAGAGNYGMPRSNAREVSPEGRAMSGGSYFSRLARAYRIVRRQGLWPLVPGSFRSRRQLMAGVVDLLHAFELVVIFLTAPLWWPFWCFYQYVLWAWFAAACDSHERWAKAAALREGSRKGGAE